MCRFVGALSKKEFLLSKFLDLPENSLIKQSKKSQEGHLGLHGDGFGIAWYNHRLEDRAPAIFKSTQPAWNDENLKSIVSKIETHCLLGHVRSATVGSVSRENCHPFHHQRWSFVHNGTIDQFDKIKQRAVSSIPLDLFQKIRGQTDSEYLFHLLLSHHGQQGISDLPTSLSRAISDFHYWQQELGLENGYRINLLLTDGIRMLACRVFYPDTSDKLSLYVYRDEELILFSSEKLWDSPKWDEMKNNTIMLVDEDFNIETVPFSLQSRVKI